MTRHEFIVFSDFHAHNFKYGSQLIPHPDDDVSGLYNSRLIDCVHVIREIGDYAKQNNIDKILFGGDLFHDRDSVDIDVLSLIYREITHLSTDHTVCMIPGNHDYGDRTGNVHTLTVFDSNPAIIVRDSCTIIELDPEMTIYVVPYTDDRAVAKQWLNKAGTLAKNNSSKHKILLAHLGMRGTTVGSDYVLLAPSDVDVQDVPYDEFTVCFFGHYHQHQKLFRNGWFVGATLQHNWGDSGTTRGFLHVVLEDGQVSFKQVETSAPKFINVKSEELAITSIKPNDFVRVFFPEGTTEAEMNKTIPNTNKVEKILQKDEEDSKMLEVKSLDPFSLVELWVRENLPETDDTEGFIDLGKLLLTRAGDKVL